MIGKKFNMLTVLEECNERDKRNKIMYKCQCDCGNIVIVNGNNLRSGNSKSCGCLNHKPNKHNFKHGKIRTRLYRIHHGMKDRCYNINGRDYNTYGHRNIVVCDEWLNDFMNFYNWAINNGYKDNLTIDRIDVNGNYEPSNCRWVDMKTQQNNKRNNIILTYNGKTQTLTQWVNELDLEYSTVKGRHYRGWSDKECLFGKEVQLERD